MEIDIARLDKLSKLDLAKKCRNEEEVKMKFIKPLLEVLGYDELDYESTRSDILVPQKILLEAKNHNVPLEKAVMQLEGYWVRQRTLIAILCNGKETRIYHPSWAGKRFEETLIKTIPQNKLLDEVDFLSNCVSFEAISSGKARHKLREIEDNEETESLKKMELKKRLAEIEKKIAEVTSNKKLQIDELNRQFDQELVPLHIELGEISKIIGYSEVIPPTTKNIPNFFSNRSIKAESTHVYSKVEALDRANFFGLTEGKQIMFCTKRTQGSYLTFWCLPDKSSLKHELSLHGQEYISGKHFENRTSFIGKIEYLKLRKNDLSFWQQLFEERLFPFWDPRRGPFQYNDPNPKSIALCQVFKINVRIEKTDIGKGQVQRNIINPEKTIELENGIATMTPVLDEIEFFRQKSRIEEIYNKFR